MNHLYSPSFFRNKTLSLLGYSENLRFSANGCVIYFIDAFQILSDEVKIYEEYIKINMGKARAGKEAKGVLLVIHEIIKRHGKAVSTYHSPIP